LRASAFDALVDAVRACRRHNIFGAGMPHCRVTSDAPGRLDWTGRSLQGIRVIEFHVGINSVRDKKFLNDEADFTLI
jgi:hypothetical protein